jgi:hypothetical protein
MKTRKTGPESASGEGIGASPSPPIDEKKKRGRRLGNEKQIRAAGVNVYRQLEAGTIKPNDARARVQTLRLLLDVITIVELARRLQTLERRDEKKRAA